MTLRSGSVEGKQSDLCKCNIIFCDVDCVCLQEEKDEASRIFLSANFGDRPAMNELFSSAGLASQVLLWAS